MEPTTASIKPNWSALRVFWKCLAALPVLMLLTIGSLVAWWRLGFDWDPSAKMSLTAYFAGGVCIFSAVAFVLAFILTLITGTVCLFSLWDGNRR